MNNPILDILTNTEIRDTKSLSEYVIDETTAGAPWLTETNAE